MENFGLVQKKLEAFIRKFYLNKIVKGSILFLGIGLLYFLVISGLEYFLWLSTTERTILFWLFILIEGCLLFFFLGIPLLKLFKISKGIDKMEASELIGQHFPEVQDKLKNLLQLRQNKTAHSDLLSASIDQRSRELSPVPFSNAIQFKGNSKYLKILIFPLLIISGLLIAGKANVITKGFNRVSDYNSVYLKPAPFQYIINNEELSGQEGSDLKLSVRTVGQFNPETIQIIRENDTYYMKQVSPGFFEYTFTDLKNDFDFELVSNEVFSGEYHVEVIKVPKLLEFQMDLDYPAYTGAQDEIQKGSGNIVVPEGTRITWDFTTRNADIVNFQEMDTVHKLLARGNKASFNKQIRKGFEYVVSSENAAIKDFEPLGYTIKVIPDEYPEIKVTGVEDSLDTDIQYFKGNVSDDYGLSKLQIVYFPEGKEKSEQSLEIPVSNESFDEFHFTFPGNLPLEKGASYHFFFRIFDNDGVSGAKSSRSESFSYRMKTNEELEEDNLQEQNQNIKKIDEQLQNFKKSDEELKEISRLEKEKEELNYNERKKLEEFIKRQKQQNAMMKNYSEKLQKNIQKKEEDQTSQMREELQRRLENNEKQLEENEALLKELEEYAEKIQKEDLGKKLEELSKKNKNSQRSLEQLLELTKRYYIEEKRRKLGRDLEKMAEEQERLSKQEEDSKVSDQEELNEDFQEFQDQMEELENENEDLKTPMDINREKIDEESIKKDQQEATENLKNQNKQDAQQKQKDAAKKMMQMSQKMQEVAMQGEMQQLEADAETLRQILDNLIVFSFGQEGLLNDFKKIQQNNPSYAAKLREQSNLRENFRHIDDSLYSLALRNPMINERIMENLTNVEFDIDKSIERLSDNEIPQGTASQQYVVTGANELANLLDNVLSSMQQMMGSPKPGQGGKGEEFQLMDIIQKQRQLNEKVKQEINEQQQMGQEGKPKEQGDGKAGELYEIYKEQQMLRLEMEKLLEENGLKNGSNPADQMELIEDQLLDKGIDPSTLQRMQQLEYQLMRFQEAQKLQGMDEKRISKTNLTNYTNDLQNQIDRAKEYFNSTEILNRQILPLRQIYREKVKEYFGKGGN